MAKADKGGVEATSSTDALALLMDDHEQIKELFVQYKALVDSAAEESERQSLAEEICTMLMVHAAIEEEIFYPAARNALADAGLLNEAQVEHESAEDLISVIQATEPGDALYDARVKVLGEYVNHHVQEEEGKLFPRLLWAGLDVAALGVELSERQEELLSA